MLRLCPECDSDATNQTLHTALFAIAGALQKTHVTLELRTWEIGETVDPWPFLDLYWKPIDPTIPSGVLALAATLTALEVCMHWGCDASRVMPVLYGHSNPPTIVSPAVQMNYDFSGPATDGLRYLCSLSRLQTASLWLTHSDPDADDAYGEVWQASNELSVLRRLALQCVLLLSDLSMCPWLSHSMAST